MSEPKKIEFSHKKIGVEKGEKPEFGAKRRVLCASVVGAAGLALLALFSGCRSKEPGDAKPEPPAASVSQQDFQILVQRLSDPDYKVAAEAARELGKLGDSRAIPLLIHIDNRDLMELVEAPTEALQMFDVEQIIPPLMDVLRAFPPGELPNKLFGEVPGQVNMFLEHSGQAGAVHLLSALDDPNPILKARVAVIIRNMVEYHGVDPAQFGSKLTGLLSDPEYIVRLEAATALGVLKYAPAVPELEKCLKEDPNWMVRSNVARALGEIGDPSAGPALQDALEDENEVVVGQAAQALGKLKIDAAVQQLIEAYSHSNITTEIGGALISIGHDAVPALIRALENPDPRIREHSAIALATICDPDAIEPLTRVSNEDPDFDVRSAASYAARTIADGCSAQDQEAPEGD
ncbi:MAG: HEAT repeat domain-containing protein [Candidatus Micrarchaeota archaeon]|nr:HEAT repeat domain-containing protein [Candidatus Micrarchaeota archaeon]